MRWPSRLPAVVLACAFVLAGCIREETRSTLEDASAASPDDGGSAFGFNGDDSGPIITVCQGDGPCLPNCGSVTALTGTVLDPAGRLPVANAVVYIPQLPPAPIVVGTSTCSACGQPIVDYIAATVTDSVGSFTLNDVPTGKNIPIVTQVGKWRRESFVPSVPSCKTTAVSTDLTRLPRNRSEGDLPQMAVLTGGCDDVACFLRRVGIDAQEFTGPDGGGRVHVYRGAAPGADLAGGGGGTAGDCSGADGGTCSLWSSKAALERYDTVLLGCECGANDATKPDKTPMHDWVDEGGMLIAVHGQETWFRDGPADFAGLASWLPLDGGPASGPLRVVTQNLPRGVMLQQWLADAGALSADGTVPYTPADVLPSVANVNAPAQAWLYEETDAGDAGGVASTPYWAFWSKGDAGGSPPCGRGVATDVHVGAANRAPTVPAGCAAGGLSPEELPLEYLLFDTTNCAQRRTSPPPPPNLTPNP
jgi:hypothetical protein